MEVGVVLIVGSASGDALAASNVNVLNETFSSAPAVMLDVLGEPVLHRIVESLHQSGVGPICLVVDPELANDPVIEKMGRSRVQVVPSSENEVGAATQRALTTFKDQGLRTGIIMRAAAYVELDIAEMVHFHRNSRQRITFVRDGAGRLDMTIVDCAAPEKVSLSLSRVWASMPATRDYFHGGYTNRLRGAKDLRRLAQDALLRRCRIRPNGVEVRGGIWIAKSARLHPRARVVGPAYVGANTRLRAGALVTRCASIERNCEVSCGCVVEDASILPGTFLGVGLEIAHVVVDRTRLVDVRRNIEVEIGDLGIIGSTSFEETFRVRDLIRSLSARAARSAWQRLSASLDSLLTPRPEPVPASEQPADRDSKAWPMFEKLPGTVNSGTV